MEATRILGFLIAVTTAMSHGMIAKEKMRAATDTKSGMRNVAHYLCKNNQKMKNP